MTTTITQASRVTGALLSELRAVVGRGDLLHERVDLQLYEYDAFGDRLVGFLEEGTAPELGKADLGDVWAARKIVMRALRHYVFSADVARRRFALRIFRHLLRTRMRRVDEAIFHMVIYKHLREFYFAASEERVPLADDLVKAGQAA